MGTDGRLYFHERILRGGVNNLLFWENYGKDNARIYQVDGFNPCEIKKVKD
jgi:hypothetical protein